MSKLRIGNTYRYAADASPHVEVVDDFPNFFHVTYFPDGALVKMDRGISPIAKVPSGGAVREDRVPAIVLSSNMHGKGSADNPWQDVMDPDHGYIKYFGDSKAPGDPALSPGNKALLAQHALHTSGDASDRAKASPIIFMEAIRHKGKVKGYKRFAGFGVIERAELITQHNEDIGYFTNYVFTFTVLSLNHSDEDECLDWTWINDRRTAGLETLSTLEHAPYSWKQWIRLGNQALPRLRRRVSLAHLESPDAQLPTPGSEADKALKTIYSFYKDAGRTRFELLASRVVMNHVNATSSIYKEGWITRGSGDGGIDFVGKIELGTGFPSVGIIVLGQAKCEDPRKATNGKDLARTVARLKRGWIGAYVTTGYFSKPSQAEIIEDQYPLIKINGLVLANETLKLCDEEGHSTVLEYLRQLEQEYPDRVQERRPEEFLLSKEI